MPALKAGANSGTGAWRSPSPTRAGKAAARGSGLGSAAKFAEEDGADGEGAVALANAIERGGRRRGGVGGGERPDGFVPVEPDLAFAGGSGYAVVTYDPPPDGEGLFAEGGVEVGAIAGLAA